MSNVNAWGAFAQGLIGGYQYADKIQREKEAADEATKRYNDQLQMRKEELAYQHEQDKQNQARANQQIALQQQQLEANTIDKQYSYILDAAKNGNLDVGIAMAKSYGTKMNSNIDFGKMQDRNGKQVIFTAPKNMKIDFDAISSEITNGSTKYRINGMNQLQLNDGNDNWSTLADGMFVDSLGVKQSWVQLSRDEKKSIGLPDNVFAQKDPNSGKIEVKSLNSNTSVKLNAGERLVYDDNGNIVSVEPIPGSKAYIEQQKAEKSAEYSVEQTRTDAINVLDSIDQADKDLDKFWATGLPAMVSQFGKGTAYQNLESSYANIKSVLALTQMKELKESSSTGATGLGALNQSELTALESRVANLSQEADKPTQRSALYRIKEQYMKSYIKASFYDNGADYGFEKPKQTKYNDKEGWIVAGRFVSNSEMQRILSKKEYNKMRLLTSKDKGFTTIEVGGNKVSYKKVGE